MAAVEIRGLRKSFGAVEVIKGVDVTIGDGEFVVLVGPSGCGKSTLLRTIAGLEETSAGDIYIGGRHVNGLEPRERDIAMVFQTYALYPHMTVRENMAFNLTLRRAPKAEIRQKVAEAAEILGLQELLDRKPRQLSGGQRQRVAMGRAIVRHPQVFLFDEPLSNLDAKLRVQMRAEIRGLHDRLRATSIYVTHDQVEAMTMADRIVVLDAGEVAQVGTPLELYDRPDNRFVAEFIGSPSINMFDAVVTNGGTPAAEIPGGGRLPLPPKAPSPGTPIHLGIRPEDLHLDPSGPLRGAVTLIEQLGPEALSFVNIGGKAVCFRQFERPDFSVGDSVALGVANDRLHLFDRGSGRRLN
jgi:multiple sugar transport system ATP-binding protein